MKWKIVADSGITNHLPANFSSEISCQIVPLMINIGKEVYIDDETLNLEHFIEEMETSKESSSSACPSPERYAHAFEEGENIICFTLSSALSGSYNSAQLAKQLTLEKYPNKQIHIIDSRSAGPEMDLLIEYTLSLILDGNNFTEILTKIDTYQQQTGLLFMLASVDNLVKNGRLNKLVGSMIGLLNIRLIGERTPQADIGVIHKSKGTKRALQTLLNEMIAKGFKGGRVIIAHSLNLEAAENLKNLILSHYPNTDISIRKTAALCTYYAQRGGLLVGYIRS